MCPAGRMQGAEGLNVAAARMWTGPHGCGTIIIGARRSRRKRSLAVAIATRWRWRAAGGRGRTSKKGAVAVTSAPGPGTIARAARRELVAALASLLAAPTPGSGVARSAAGTTVCAPPGALLVPRLAEGHGVAALLAPLLEDRLPPEPAAELADAVRRTLGRGAWLAADWQRLQRALTGAGVPHAPLKWADLAARLYRPPASRPAADLDILVPPEHANAAESVLRKLGYTLVAETWKHRVFLLEDNRTVVDPRGEHPRNPRPVEVHTWLGEGFRGLRVDFTREVAFSTSGAPLPVAVALTHLAAHATVDALGRSLRLIQLVDLMRLSAHLSEGDWLEVLRLGATANAARFIWPALALAEQHLMAPVPAPVLVGLSAAVQPRLRQWVATADLDGLSWFGRADTPRDLGEVPAIWPRNSREHWTVWRFLVAPGVDHLADRNPLSSERRGRLRLYAEHGAYSVRRLVERWRLRR